MRVVFHCDFFFKKFFLVFRTLRVITRAHLLRSVFTKSRYYCILSRYVFGTFSCSRGYFIFYFYFLCVLSTGTIYFHDDSHCSGAQSRFVEKNIFYNYMSKIVWWLLVYRYNITQECLRRKNLGDSVLR